MRRDFEQVLISDFVKPYQPGWAWLTHPSGPVESQSLFCFQHNEKEHNFWKVNGATITILWTLSCEFGLQQRWLPVRHRHRMLSFHVIFMQTEDQLEPMGSNNLYIFSTCTKKSRDSAAESHLIVHADHVRGLCSPWLKRLRRTRVSAADSAGSKLVQSAGQHGPTLHRSTS